MASAGAAEAGISLPRWLLRSYISVLKCSLNSLSPRDISSSRASSRDLGFSQYGSFIVAVLLISSGFYEAEVKTSKTLKGHDQNGSHITFSIFSWLEQIQFFPDSRD